MSVMQSGMEEVMRRAIRVIDAAFNVRRLPIPFNSRNQQVSAFGAIAARRAKHGDSLVPEKLNDLSLDK